MTVCCRYYIQVPVSDFLLQVLHPGASDPAKVTKAIPPPTARDWSDRTGNDDYSQETSHTAATCCVYRQSVVNTLAAQFCVPG